MHLSRCNYTMAIRSGSDATTLQSSEFNNSIVDCIFLVLLRN
jgi:hypothetical protein